MLQIACPWCGLRDEDEYRHGGESHAARPATTADDALWGDYLFNRVNPRGVHCERWLHAYGCGRWFNIARDTVTHEILAVYRMGEPRPARAGTEP
jgi:sarcosine oxidase, subunit delta